MTEIEKLNTKLKPWNFYNAEFSYLQDSEDFTWFGHIYFAYDIIRNLKPKVFVELGTYKGTSFFSFCQAVVDEKLDTQLNAIDCWEGDEQTGFYGEEAYTQVNFLKEKYFKNLKNINLLRMTFETAVKQFKDKSVDIIHIDGLHTYEAVKEDYMTWKDKITDDGVLLFHDTRVPEYGVAKFWEELQKEHPEYHYMNFTEHFGLGVVFKSDKYLDLVKNSDEVNEHYKSLGHSFYAIQHLLRLQGKRDGLLHQLLQTRKELEQKNSALELQQVNFEQELAKNRDEFLGQVAAKEQEIAVLDKNLQNVTAELSGIKARKVIRALNKFFTLLNHRLF
jgi:hypothetical protein